MMKRLRFDESINLDGLILFLSTLSYTLFDREGLNHYFYAIQLIFFGYYFFFIIKNKVIWINNSRPIIHIYFSFFIFCFLSIFWSYDKYESFSKSITVFQILINSYILYDFLNKTRTIEYVFYALTFTTVINFMILIEIIPSSPANWDSWRFQGTRDNPNYLAVLQLVTIFFNTYFIKSKQGKSLIIRVIFILSISLAFYVMIMTGSKKGIFMSVPFFLYLTFDNFKKIWFNLVLVFTIIYFSFVGLDSIYKTIGLNEDYSRILKRVNEFLSGEGTSTIERVSFIKGGLNIFYEHPFFGVGIGGLKKVFGTYSHSNFIDLLAGLGAIGFAIFYSMYFKIFGRIRKIKGESKLLFFFFLSCLLVLDIAQVTYYYKFSIFILVVFIFLVENLSVIAKKEIVN